MRILRILLTHPNHFQGLEEGLATVFHPLLQTGTFCFCFSLPVFEVYCIRLSVFPCLVIACFHYFFSLFSQVSGEGKALKSFQSSVLIQQSAARVLVFCFCLGTVALPLCSFVSGCVSDQEKVGSRSTVSSNTQTSVRQLSLGLFQFLFSLWLYLLTSLCLKELAAFGKDSSKFRGRKQEDKA